MTQNASSAEYIINQFGGVRKTARALGIWHGTVSKWQSAKKIAEKRRVPARYHKKILELAKLNGLNIKAEHFIGL